MKNLLTELINATLTGKPLELEGVKEEDWEQCFETARQQQVLAMTFPTMSALPKEQRPGFLQWSKWMAYAQSTTEQSRQKQEALKKLGAWLAEEGLSTMVIKGFSVAVHYPNPNLREFSDIDIYSGPNYEAVNNCLTRHGLQLGRPDGHHIHINVEGVTVEHHFALHNARVRYGKGMEGPVATLERLAVTGRINTSMPGIAFPNATFTALFTAWHAHKHFLAEKIELRHLVDWALALRQLTAEEAAVVHETKDSTPWGRFADTLTAIALHRLHLPEEWFQQRELEAASVICPELEQRVWADIMASSRTAHGRTTMHRRLKIARRMMQNRWKYKEFADMGAGRWVWRQFVGWCKG